MATARKKTRERFGIAEWYGRNFVGLSPTERQAYAQELLNEGGRSLQPCPFKPSGGKCSKPSGICSIRPYIETTEADGQRVVTAVVGDSGRPRATCPNRFHEGKLAYQRAGEILLDNPAPTLVPEVGFLEPIAASGKAKKRDVGRIDLVLMNPADQTGRVEWGALEIQAVYFSGKGMLDDFTDMAGGASPGLPFPQHPRRPDYRSSGPKRLLPQLQTKVPTLSRWGKRMAVVVDEYFFDALDPMTYVDDLSSADIAWVVVKFEDTGSGNFQLTPSQTYFTTLPEAVAGLTGGRPSTEAKFLQKLLEKAARNAPLDLDTSDESGGE